MTSEALIRFVTESNMIEGINRAPTAAEIKAHVDFLALPSVTIAALEDLVAVCQPGAKLRREPGMNVRVGNHVALAGGGLIEPRLREILEHRGLSAYERHVRYEILHPFMDGNGRSGRALWLHDMGGIEQVPLGFLHTFYYQALAASR